jgi:serine protease Do
LVDLNGNLLGIPTAILSRTGGYMGVGFAIPSNMAKPILQSLLETGRVSRSYLGVTIQEVNQDLAKALGLDSARGVLVSDVAPGSPSAKAGIQRGDVILEVDGKAMSTTGQLRNTIATAGVGKQVELQVWRKGKSMKLAVSLAAMPEEGSKVPANPPGESGAVGPLGTRLAPLDAEARRQLHVPPDVKTGVVVTDVDVASPAFEAGIRRGDVILELGGAGVTSPERLAELWQKSSGTVPVLLLREGRTLFVAVKHR